MNDKKLIYLVDDDSDLAEIVTAFFKQKNVDVVHQTDPIKALSDLKAGRVTPDVVITDLNMPELSGVEFIKRAKEQGAAFPIILITVSHDVDVAVSAMEVGAADFVVKPLHFPQLWISIQRAMKLFHLSDENQTLREAVNLSRGITPDGVIGKSPAIKQALELAQRAAKSTATVLITGESGAGKEIFAKTIHNSSPRSKKSFVAINCSAIPENLLESELFGHAKGSFTGASDKKIGLFEEADGGTLFLDEIGDLNLSLQAKLLRVLQEKKIKRVGENNMRPVDVRIVCATHKNLAQEIKDKNFREDLFFRLNVIPLHIPPLRDRKEDILPLAEFFLKKFSALNNVKLKGFSPEAVNYILNQTWTGNVRELENSIERAVVLAESDRIDINSFLLSPPQDLREMSVEHTDLPTGENVFAIQYGENFETLKDVEKKYIKHVYLKNGQAKESTAKILGIDRKTLYTRLQEIDLEH